MITDNDLQNVTLVGHSLAGVWMQLLLQQMPDRVGMMIFVDAVALETGESFFDNQIAGIVPTYPIYPAQASLQSNLCAHCDLLLVLQGSSVVLRLSNADQASESARQGQVFGGSAVAVSCLKAHPPRCAAGCLPLARLQQSIMLHSCVMQI